MSRRPRTVVAMSGGVDSSVAAHLLKKQGHEVLGVFMRRGKQYEGGEAATARSGRDDSLDARRVAEQLEIPFEVLNLEAEFAELVDYFCSEYGAGRTPNPCVMCNRRVKFEALTQYADAVGAGHVATGHYARIQRRDGRYLLLQARDKSKDQSYVLVYLTQDQLARTIFPNGEMTKMEIRRIAEDLDLPVKDKPESQDICFIPGSDYARFLHERMPEAARPGPVKDLEGNVVGEHPGVRFFTVGQRRGLRIAFGRPMYVVRLEPESNTVVVGPDQALLSHELTASGVNWIIDPPAEPFKATVKIRYKQQPLPAAVHPLPGSRARVVFDRPARAVTPGQAAVFYQEEVVAGGGWID